MKTILKKILVVVATFVLIGVIIAFDIYMIGDTFSYKYVESGIREGYTTARLNREGVISIESFQVKDGEAVLNLKAIAPGHCNIIIDYGDGENNAFSTTYYVNSLHIITKDAPIGTFNKLKLIIIELQFLLLFVFLLSIMNAIISYRRFCYSYRAVFYSGLSIFFGGLYVYATLIQTIVSDNDDLYLIYYRAMSIISGVAGFAFPFVILLCIYMIISNIVLMKREGVRLLNGLCIVVAVMLIVGTILGQNMYTILDGVIDVHSSKGHVMTDYIESLLCLFVYYFESMLLGTFICLSKTSKILPSFDADYIIILGCAIRKNGTLTPLLKSRVDRALWFADWQKRDTGRDVIFVPSGGKGSDEIMSEAAAMRNYLLEKGVDDDHILVEDKSTTTRENMIFSRKLIRERDEKGKVIFATNRYHVLRSGYIASLTGFPILGVGSRTVWYFNINAILREFAAMLNIVKTKHIIILIFLVMLLSFMAFMGLSIDMY